MVLGDPCERSFDTPKGFTTHRLRNAGLVRSEKHRILENQKQSYWAGFSVALKSIPFIRKQRQVFLLRR